MAAAFWSSIAFTERALRSEEGEGSGIPCVELVEQAGQVHVKK